MTASTTTNRPRAVDNLTGGRTALSRERELRQQVFQAPSKLTLSEWSDRYRFISEVASAEPGKWRTARAPFQRGMMDAISDRRVQRVAIVGGSQWGKSEMLINTAFYFIHQEPSPILMVRPTIEDARDFSEDRIKSNAEVTPVIKARLKRSGGRRESGDKMLRKAFIGGHMTLVGSNSATGLANRPIRVVLFDEVDKYKPSAGDKGDPIKLAENRTQTFRHRRKVVKVSTPGVKGVSKIIPEYELSDQRRYFVPCPHCDHFQTLTWRRGEKENAHFTVDRDDATYCCEGCGVSIEERHKTGMLERGEWRATNPVGQFPGFHINALYSPWVSWRELVDRFTEAKDAPDKLQVFVNEALAELWDPHDAEGVDPDTLAARREKYAAEVPAGVGVLTAAIDVQHDRLELVVKGYGAGQESWLIAHHRLYGDPSREDVWNRADLLLLKGYQHERGATLRISATFVDSGDGQTVHHVYGFVVPRQSRGVYATKGLSTQGNPVINPAKKHKKYKVRVIGIGTDTAKDIIFPRLKLRIPDGGAPPPGYMHFPLAQLDGADDEYLRQFGREKAFVRNDGHGTPVRHYEKVPPGSRNEAIDLEVLSLAALHMLGAGVYDQLGVWAAKACAEGDAIRKAAETSAPPPLPQVNWPKPVEPPRRPPGTGYLNSWR